MTGSPAPETLLAFSSTQFIGAVALCVIAAVVIVLAVWIAHEWRQTWE